MYIRTAKERLIEPDKGLRCKVVKGRKVPLATEGVIFWVGDRGYGTSVGFKDSSGVTHWTAIGNIITTGFGLDFGEDPPNGWDELALQVLKAKEDAKKLSHLPEIGHTVALVSDPKNAGMVFWAEGTRLGFKRSKNAEPTWAELDGVVRILLPPKGISVYVLEEPVLPNFSKKPLEKELISEENAIKGLKSITDLPEPLCNIRQITKNEKGIWVALDSEGDLVTLLPRETALEVCRILESKGEEGVTP